MESDNENTGYRDWPSRSQEVTTLKRATLNAWLLISVKLHARMFVCKVISLERPALYFYIFTKTVSN